MSTIVRTQAELDAAINAGAENIIIDSPAGVQIDAWGSFTVTARGSSTVTAGSYTAVHLHSGRKAARIVTPCVEVDIHGREVRP